MQVDCGYFESAGGDKWLTTKEVSYALTEMGRTDNEHYLYSALGYQTPRQFEREYHTKRGTQR